MIVDHFGFMIDVGHPEFGNDVDIQIRDKMYAIEKLMKPKKGVPKRKEKAEAIIVEINKLVKTKNEKSN